MVPGPQEGGPTLKVGEPRAQNLAGDSWAPAQLKKADEPRARNQADEWPDG
jgi:hypothetical protein